MAKKAAKAAETKLKKLEKRSQYLDEVLTDPSKAKDGKLKKKLASPGGAADVRREYEFVLAKISELDPAAVVPPVAALCVHCGHIVHDSNETASACATANLRKLHGGVQGRATTAEKRAAFHDDDGDDGDGRVAIDNYDDAFAEMVLDLTEA